jgi:hypothetical protein
MQLRRVSRPTGRSAVQTLSGKRPVPPKLPRARAAVLIESVADAAGAASATPDRAISCADTEQRAACTAQASERESSSLIESVADAGASASVTPERAISGADTEQRERPVPLKLPRARAAALIKSVADGTAAASVTPDTAISGARAERRETCSAQASESESSSLDRECCRRSCGGERHTRTGDQRCKRRTARVLCRSSFREREQQR